jgi:hypothetical protein
MDWWHEQARAIPSPRAYGMVRCEEAKFGGRPVIGPRTSAHLMQVLRHI